MMNTWKSLLATEVRSTLMFFQPEEEPVVFQRSSLKLTEVDYVI